MRERRSPHTPSVSRAALALLLLALSAGAGCDRAAPGDGGTTGSAGAAARAAKDPRALGEAIGRVYLEAMGELAPLVEARPPAAALRPQVEALHARHVETLVALGAAREALDAAERRAVDRATTRTIMSVGSIGWLQEAARHYRAQDNDLANRIADFNTLTQYAFYELLREQRPDEAARLGIAGASDEAGP